MTQTAPIQRFLGRVRLDQGPFGLLGLSPDRYDHAEINRALAAQLGRLGRHPQGMSTEADEVRLVLHVAAAQLRDPEVQRELLVECSYPPRARTAPERSGDHAGGAARPESPAPRPAPDAIAIHTSQVGMFERAALWVLVHSGGWNREAQRRLGSLAHTFGLDELEFRRALNSIGRRASATASARRRREAARASSNGPGPEAPPGDALEEAPTESISVASWGRLAALIVLAVLTMVMLWRIVTIRIEHARELRQAHAAITAGQEPAELVERTITMPGLPPPAQRDRGTQGPGSTSQVPTGAALPLPSTGDLELPAELTASKAIDSWDRRAQSSLSRARRARKPEEMLEESVRLAIVNLAAAQHWAGASDSARATLRRAEVFRAPPSTRSATDRHRFDELLESMTSPGALRDGDVGLLLLLARRQPTRYMPELRQLRFGNDPLGPVDADIAAETVYAAAPDELRQFAMSIVFRQSDNPVMIHALIEGLTSEPRRELAGRVIEQVTGRSLADAPNGSWRLHARRHLVSRLLDLLGAQTAEGAENLAEHLSRETARTAIALGAPDLSSTRLGEPSSVEPAQAMRSLARRWRELGKTYSGASWFAERVEQLEQGRDLRLALARGPIQRCGVEQIASIEHMAELVRAERPSQTTAIDSILDAYRQSRSEAKHVFDQIAAGQVSATKLWRLRFGLMPIAD